MIYKPRALMNSHEPNSVLARGGPFRRYLRIHSSFRVSHQSGNLRCLRKRENISRCQAFILLRAFPSRSKLKFGPRTDRQNLGMYFFLCRSTIFK